MLGVAAAKWLAVCSPLPISWRGGVFCWNWLKLRISFQPLMQKAIVVEQKTQHSFVDSHETMWGSQSGERVLNRLLDLLI